VTIRVTFDGSRSGPGVVGAEEAGARAAGRSKPRFLAIAAKAITLIQKPNPESVRCITLL
jgi:hypothetical protein